MLIEPEGWFMDPDPPSWDGKAKTFSFFRCIEKERDLAPYGDATLNKRKSRNR